MLFSMKHLSSFWNLEHCCVNFLTSTMCRTMHCGEPLFHVQLLKAAESSHRYWFQALMSSIMPVTLFVLAVHGPGMSKIGHKHCLQVKAYDACKTTTAS